MLDSAKDKLSAENDALAAEGEALKELWEAQPQWSSAATINFLIQENLRLKCRLCEALDRAGVVLPLNLGSQSSVAAPVANDALDLQRSASPQTSKFISAATSSASPSEPVSASASASASADGEDGASDGGGDQTSSGTQSEAGSDEKVTEEDIDAALNLFIEPSPGSSPDEASWRPEPATDANGAHTIGRNPDKTSAPDTPEPFIR